VAVIGGGWSGLAAALILARAGRRVTVFEAARTLGGRARSVVVNERAASDSGAGGSAAAPAPNDAPLRLDNGQHVLIGAYREALRLIRVAGVDAQRALLRVPLELRYVDGFRLRAARLPYPFNLAHALLTCASLSRSEAWAAARMMAGLRWRRFRVQPDVTVSEFLAAQGQSETLKRYLWEPLCLSALNTRPDVASAQVFAHVLRDGLGGSRDHSDLLIPRVDLGRLFPEPAAERLKAMGARVELGAAVQRIAHDQGQRRGRYIVHARGETTRFDGVVVAVAPQHAHAVLEGVAELQPACALLAEFAYEPILTCYLQYPPQVRLPAPMLGFTEGLTQWAFDRGQIAGDKGIDAARHAGLMAAVISASGRHEELPREEIETRVAAEIAGATAHLDPPLWMRSITERRATWSCRPGTARPAMRTPLPGLVLAGDYIEGDYPGTLEAAARNGVAAARALIDAQP